MLSVYIHNFLKYRNLLGELVARDIKVKYRRSVLGVLWTLLNPLFMMIILSIVFSNLFKFDVENFPIYLLSGQVIFNFFSDSTTNSMNAIVQNGSLIKKVYVPKYLFVISRVISSIINLLASFSALILVMLALRVELEWPVLLVWLPMSLLMVFCLGVGMFLSAVTVKFRDIQHLYSVFMTGLMYLTPVIYPMSILPDWLYKVVMLNPVTNYLEMFRGCMMNNILPGAGQLLLGFLEAVIMLVLGIYVFIKSQDEFILNL